MESIAGLGMQVVTGSCVQLAACASSTFDATAGWGSGCSMLWHWVINILTLYNKNIEVIDCPSGVCLVMVVMWVMATSQPANGNGFADL